MADPYMIALGRSGARWREVQAIIFRTHTHCWRCGEFVDQDLPPEDRWSRTVDHVIPLDQGGPPLELANLRLAHRTCNSKAGRGQQTNTMPRSETL